MDAKLRPGVRPLQSEVIACYTTPPPDVTVICADELGVGDPAQLPTRVGLDGHRVKAPLDYSRGPEKTWVHSTVRLGDGRKVTLTAPSRNRAGYQYLLTAVDTANADRAIVATTDNLSTPEQLQHPHMAARSSAHPPGIHLQRSLPAQPPGGWWRLFRREALARQSFAIPHDITLTTSIATSQLNARACVWGRPPPTPPMPRL